MAVLVVAQQPINDRVLVCGGRDFVDRDKLFHILDTFHAHRPIETVIHGAAQGADSLAGEWAKSRDVPVLEFPADWQKHGKAAGPIRNRQMLDEGKPGLVIAFRGGRGTADMVRRARAESVDYVQYF